jgi:hypothetical protein
MMMMMTKVEVKFGGVKGEKCVSEMLNALLLAKCGGGSSSS